MDGIIVSIIVQGVVVVFFVIGFIIHCEIDNRKRAETEIEIARQSYRGWSFDKELVKDREEKLKKMYGKYYYPPYSKDTKED